jgi:hypothetical protein
MYLDYLTPQEVLVAKFGAAKRGTSSTILHTAAAAK